MQIEVNVFRSADIRPLLPLTAVLCAQSWQHIRLAVLIVQRLIITFFTMDGE
jgi:hypothetical protein